MALNYEEGLSHLLPHPQENPQTLLHGLLLIVNTVSGMEKSQLKLQRIAKSGIPFFDII